jgi:hypothetical protein
LGFYADNRIIGGAERYLADLLEWHDRARYDIRLFTNRNERFTEYLAKLSPVTKKRGNLDRWSTGGGWRPPRHGDDRRCL